MEHHRSTTSGNPCGRSASTPSRRARWVSYGVAQARAETPAGRELNVLSTAATGGTASSSSRCGAWCTGRVAETSRGDSPTPDRAPGYLTLLAERDGAAVTPFVVAAMDGRGDTLFSCRDGFGDDGEISDELLTDTRSPPWHGHRHGGITPDRLHVAEGSVFLADLDRATIGWDDTSRQFDQAQLLIATDIVVGTERAVAAASVRARRRTARRDDQVRAISSHDARAAKAGRCGRSRHRRSPQGRDRRGRR